jgi:nucleoside-diphosphate-sugar epimerase
MKAKSEERPAILVTGGAGLIGKRVIESLSRAYQVVGLDVYQRSDTPKGTDWVLCDLTEDASTTSALTLVRNRYGDRLASVVHLAAYYDFSGKPSDLYSKLTVEGTRRLLKGLQESRLEQFIFSSTLLVMQPVEEEGRVITESSPLETTWDYPRSKIEAEQVIDQQRGKIHSVILRISGVYDEDCHSIPIAQQISRIYEKTLESYFFPGNSEHGQPFVHLDDLIDCFSKTIHLRSELDEKEVFLIAEPDIMSYADLQDNLGELIHGREWPTIRLPKVVAKAGAWVQEKIAGEEETFIKPWMIDLADAHYPVSIDRARTKLQWRPRHRLRDSLAAMVRRLKSDPKRWYETNKLPPPEDEEKHSSVSEATARPHS